MPKTANTNNIMVGAGYLYVAAGPASENVVTPLPARVAGTSFRDTLDAAGSGFMYIGATSGGVEVSFSPDIGEVEVDQLKDSALIFNTGQTMTVGTELAEPTLANLLITWGLSSDALSTTADGDELGIPAMADELVERSIVLVGNAPRGTAGTRKERIYYGRRCVNVEGGAHSLGRTDATTLPVTFRMLPDTTVDAARAYGTVLDRTVA